MKKSNQFYMFDLHCDTSLNCVFREFHTKKVL